MTNKEKFLKLVSNEKTSTSDKLKERIRNRAMLRESQKIALKVLVRLDELNWSQKDLASQLQVSPQQVSKIVSGKENLTIETLTKLQTLLDIPLLASYYEKKVQEMVKTIEQKIEAFAEANTPVSGHYQASQGMKVTYRDFTNKYTYSEAV